MIGKGIVDMSDLRESWDEHDPDWWKEEPSPNKGKKTPVSVAGEAGHGGRAKVFGGSVLAGIGLGLLAQFGSSTIDNATSVVPGVGIVPSQVDKPSSRPAPRPVTYLDMIN